MTDSKDALLTVAHVTKRYSRGPVAVEDAANLRPYRTGTIPRDAPLPHLTVRRVTDWIMRRPEHLTETESKCLGELCERSPALATATEYARRLASIPAGIVAYLSATVPVRRRTPPQPSPDPPPGGPARSWGSG